MNKPYDPLTFSHCQSQPFAPSYWANTIALSDPAQAPLTDQAYDVAIIGGGFSGLLTAYYLASEFNISCCVLEANQVGFGASGRNAGFVLKGSGRLSYPQMAKKWGMDTCNGIYREFSEAVQRVDNLITDNAISCDRQPNGYLKIAHNLNAMEKLQVQAHFLKQLGDNTEFLSSYQLKQTIMDNKQAYGAMRLPDGFGVNPLKLVLGYRDLALGAGVKIFENSLVSHSSTQNGQHTLYVNNISVRAKTIVYAGNAYNNKSSHPSIDNKYLPILSSIMVTRPLTIEEIKQTGLKTNQVIMDTRTLKYYYRLLPDNRLLFGGRGAVFASQQHNPKYLNGLKKGLTDCFPCLTGITPDYYWNGFIAAALDDMPHVHFENNIGYILGYCGAGVGFSAQAAFRMAQKIAGIAPPSLPIYQTPLPYLPFPRLRRWGQLAYYQYATVMDRFT